jgi:hypothetical protein
MLVPTNDRLAGTTRIAFIFEEMASTMGKDHEVK